MNRFFTFLTIILCALLAATAHPFRWADFYFESSWITFFTASLGLFVALPKISKGTAWQRFGKGLLFGFVFFVGVYYWVAYALSRYGDLPWYIAASGIGSLALYCGIYWGLWSLLCGSDLIRSRPTFEKIIAWGACYAGVESLRQIIITGFPWGELGNAFYFSPLIARTVSIWGIHGLSFLWISIIAALLHLRDPEFRPSALKYLSGVIGIVLITGLILPHLKTGNEETQIAKFGVVQPDIPQDLKWDPSQSYSHLKKLIELSSVLDQENPAVILWPETSFPFSLSERNNSVPMKLKSPLIFGAVVHEEDSNRNSVVFSKDGQIISRFDKMHLVPFGEYVPLKDIIPFGKVVANAGDFKPGDESQQLFELASNIKVGPLVCYEDIFNRSSVFLARKGAQVLINFTNDAWYGPSSALAQHAALAQMQALQTGLPMIRVTNNGLSMVASPESRIDLPILETQAQNFDVAVPVKPRLTFFVWTYPFMEWIWIFIFAIASVWKNPRSKRKIFFQKSSPF